MLPEKDTLPNKLSDLLLLALADLEKVEKDPKFRVNMGIWFRTNHKCNVCMAGAIMAQTLGITKADAREHGEMLYFGEQYDLTPWDLPREIYQKLVAINDAREGSFQTALQTFGEAVGYFEIPDCIANTTIPDYGTRPGKQRELWRAYIQDFIGILQAEGL